VSLTYRAAGVDVSRADDALGRVRERIRKTKRPEVIGEIGQFGGLFASPGVDRVLVATTDGVGTKLEIARLMDRHEVVGTDLVNHCVNDALAMGAEPLFFLDYFATSELDPAVFARVVGAMADACARNGAALIGGETAEMPGMYGAGAYDLAGFLVGAVPRDDVLGPDRVREGDALVGLPSTGLHTNGYSLARAILSRAGGREGRTLTDLLGEQRRDLADETIGEALLAPHRSYLAEFRSLRDAVRIHAIAHLTGGGWEGNLPRALPEGLAAEVDRAAWSVPRLFTLLAELGRVSEAESFDVWNMGVGIVFVVARDDLDAALGALPEALEIGRVVAHTDGARVRLG
jgi:phosphoribosylformylglycinamidine cyclo-ligase